MKTYNLTQGAPEWHAHRAQHRNASDAPAMLGCSPYETRSALLARLHSGIAPEVDAATQRRFADGHRFEALARPLAEEIIGDDLAPVVGVLEGTNLSASFDGLTLMGDTAFEHKTLNQELRECMESPDEAGRLPKHYRVQMEQQLIVSGSERVLFMATSWEGEACAEQRHCWYMSDLVLRAEILAGWKQFEADLAAYVPPAAEDPKPTGRAPESLPALRIEITGAVTASNLADFKATALGAIRSVNRELTTDQHFADAEQAVKWCSDVESRIKGAKDHALSQTASIDELFRTLDEVSAEARRVRLDLEKLVDRRKVEIKGELVAAAKSAYDRHVEALRAETGCWKMLSPPDFGGAIKGKRSVSAIKDALDVALAAGKIAADESARFIRAALAALDEHSKGYEHLFADRLTFIGMSPDAVRLTVKDRIEKHQAAEQERAAALAEKERERIRREEAAKLAREQQEREALERRQSEPAAAPPAATAAPTPAPSPAPAPQVLQMRPAAGAKPTLKLGDLNARIAPLSVTADGLAQLGFTATKERGASKYYEADFPSICDALRLVLERAAAELPQAA